jgi:ATP-dependent protease ClpP protease subunit
MPKKFWQFRNMADSSAELLLYGNISDSSWWGDEVTPKQFADELSALGTVSNITVRINSGGGDVFAAQAIGNLLEQHPAEVVAHIDGLCASAATIVACHCNKVEAAEDSTYMVHPVKMGICDYVDATTMQQYISALATIKENIVTLYAKKTCREKDEVAGWMDATSWWTGAQAKENGFVDELLDDGTTTVVENRSGVLFVNSIDTHLPFDKAPKFVQDSMAAAPAASSFVNKIPAQQPENKQSHKEVTDMAQEIKTVDDLRGAYPALVDQIEQAAAQTATNTERQRIQNIEEMALPGSEEVTNEAKFTKPISASDYAVAMVKNAKSKGASYLAGASADAKNSGADGVQNQQTGAGKTDDFMDAIKGLNKKQ